MPRKKEISEDLRSRIADVHKAGKTYNINLKLKIFSPQSDIMIWGFAVSDPGQFAIIIKKEKKKKEVAVYQGILQDNVRLTVH